MSYRLRDKKKRNEEMYQYWKLNQELTYDEIGEKFEVTGSRAFAIIKKLKDKDEELAKI
jgi:hypothetical protein